MEVQIEYSTIINELIQKYNCFEFFEKIPELNEENMIWNRGETQSHDIQVMVIGKTGYGKSSTLNAIIGKDVFETDDVEACTKFLYCADFKLNTRNNCYLSLCDLPGIGEAKEVDTQYYEWYKEMLRKSHCVVYLLRADQRDFSVDEILFNSMFDSEEDKNKVIIAINYADKVEPIDRNSLDITSKQLENLNQKISAVSKVFNTNSLNVLYYSAKTLYNIDFLVERIAKILESRFI